MQFCVCALVWYISYSQTTFAARAFFFDYSDALFEGWKRKVGWAPRAQATFMQLIGWDFGAHPINFHPLPSAEGRILPSTALRVENHMRTHRAR